MCSKLNLNPQIIKWHAHRARKRKMHLLDNVHQSNWWWSRSVALVGSVETIATTRPRCSETIYWTTNWANYVNAYYNYCFCFQFAVDVTWADGKDRKAYFWLQLARQATQRHFALCFQFHFAYSSAKMAFVSLGAIRFCVLGFGNISNICLGNCDQQLL